MDPDQTAPIGAVCSGSTLIASKLNLSVMLGNYLQQMTSADDIFRCIFFLGALGVKTSLRNLVALILQNLIHTNFLVNNDLKKLGQGHQVVINCSS